MGKPTTLALDIALCTGWAFGSELGPERWGQIVIGEHGLGPRAHAFDRKLADLLQRLRPERIWVEKAHGHSGASVMISRAFLTVVCLQAHRRQDDNGVGISVFDVAANTLKKAATGSGRAAKNPMRDAAHRYLAAYGVGYDDLGAGDQLTYDEADALCLLAYSYNDLDGGAI